MAGDAATAGTNMGTESEKIVNLKGMPGNPGRDPKARNRSGKGTIGDQAFMDALIIVVIAWVILLFFYFSLRNHNV